MEFKTAIELITKEFIKATRDHKPFNSFHEGYAVILEEMDELWEAIRSIKYKNQQSSKIREEAVQVAAMAIRFLCDLIEEE